MRIIGPMDKSKGVRIEGGSWGWVGQGEGMGKIETTVLEKQ